MKHQVTARNKRQRNGDNEQQQNADDQPGVEHDRAGGRNVPHGVAECHRYTRVSTVRPNTPDGLTTRTITMITSATVIFRSVLIR